MGQVQQGFRVRVLKNRSGRAQWENQDKTEGGVGIGSAALGVIDDQENQIKHSWNSLRETGQIQSQPSFYYSLKKCLKLLYEGKACVTCQWKREAVTKVSKWCTCEPGELRPNYC